MVIFDLNLCLGKHQSLHCNVFYIYKFTVEYVPGEIRDKCYGFCQLQVFKWQCSHFHLKGSFVHILRGVMFFKWKLVNQRNKLYHKTYVLLGVQQNLIFQNQLQDYHTG